MLVENPCTLTLLAPRCADFVGMWMSCVSLYEQLFSDDGLFSHAPWSFWMQWGAQYPAVLLMTIINCCPAAGIGLGLSILLLCLFVFHAALKASRGGLSGRQYAELMKRRGSLSNTDVSNSQHVKRQPGSARRYVEYWSQSRPPVDWIPSAEDIASQAKTQPAKFEWIEHRNDQTANSRLGSNERAFNRCVNEPSSNSDDSGSGDSHEP